jgi:hypothetical protein
MMLQHESDVDLLFAIAHHRYTISKKAVANVRNASYLCSYWIFSILSDIFYDYAPFIYLRIHFLNVHLFLHVNYYLGT